MILASANVVGGFVVTDRMLEMFKRREPPKEKDDVGAAVSQTTANLLYLVTIVCFVLALRFLSSPTTARRGNWVGAFGMAWAIGVTLALPGVHLNWRIIVGAAIGAVFGAVGRAQGEDDRDAADGGAVQRRRRRRGGTRVARGVPQPRARAGPPARRHLAGDRPVGADRVGLVRRLDGRVREAAGADLRAGRSPIRASRS